MISQAQKTEVVMGVKKRIVLLGPPGAGKGTHARDLARTLKIVHISTGDILREAVKNGTELGKKAKTFMDKGELVPDAVMAEIVSKRLSEADCVNGYILDGFPRSVEQAEILDDVFRRFGMKLDMAINVTAPEELIVLRLALRRLCKNCSATYHLKNIPPKVEGCCDHCGGELYQRNDDQESTVRRRLVVYREQSKPLVEYYQKRKILETLDGALPKDQAFSALLKIVGFENR